MQNATQDVQPLATFDLHAEKVLRQLRETQRPVELTVDGKVELVVMDAREYARLKSLAELMDDDEGLDEALQAAEEDIRMGRVRPAREVLDEIGRKLGFQRIDH